MEQKLTSTTPQHNSKHNRAPCLTATSAATTRSMGGLGPRWQTRCIVGTAHVPAVAAARAPGTKKSPPVTVAKRTWLTKRPYKRQKKSNAPAPIPQAAAPAAAPAPVPLVAVDNCNYN